MKNHSYPDHREPVPAPAPAPCGLSVSLRQLVNKLQAALLPEAVDKKSFIINDVDESVYISADENILAFIVGGLISNAVFSTSNCCIRVEAVYQDDHIQVSIRNNGVFIYSSSMHSLGHMIDAARKLGGNIGLRSEENSGISAIFSMATKNAA